MMKKQISTREMALVALFAALTALLAQIAIPIGEVPISLATLAAMLAGGVLGARLGGLSQLVYVLLGGVGVPVFAMFTGGVGIVVGPTGGYLAGYIATAVVTGLAVERFGARVRVLFPAMLLGTAACYILGTAWFMISTGTGLVASLMMCVVPFLPGDLLKIVLASVLAPRLRTHLQRAVAA